MKSLNVLAALATATLLIGCNNNEAAAPDEQPAAEAPAFEAPPADLAPPADYPPADAGVPPAEGMPPADPALEPAPAQ